MELKITIDVGDSMTSSATMHTAMTSAVTAALNVLGIDVQTVDARVVREGDEK
jgi:hypothetical protein